VGFTSMQRGEEDRDCAQRDEKENDTALTVKTTHQESRIHASSELGNNENTQTVLGDGKWNCDHDKNKLPPSGSKEEVG
jgi:hypothetical protein